MKLLLLPITLLILSATSLAQAPLYDLHGATGSSFGWGLSSMDDVDGDGFNDFLVGAPTADGNQVQSGQVMIISSVTGLVIRTWNGEHTGDRFGLSVAAIGDITGDGISDVAVGAPYWEATGGTDRGAVYIFNGATGAQLHKHIGSTDNDNLGWRVIAAGDANADGVPDYAYSAIHFSSPTFGADLGGV